MSEKIYIFKFENRSVEADALEGSVRDVSAAHNVQSLHVVLFEETDIRAEQAVQVTLKSIYFHYLEKLL